MKDTVIEGQLQICHDRGVIYFHSVETGWTVLRICRLPTPIPDVSERQLDITHIVGTNWGRVTAQELAQPGLTSRRSRMASIWEQVQAEWDSLSPGDIIEGKDGESFVKMAESPGHNIDQSSALNVANGKIVHFSSIILPWTVGKREDE